MAKQRNNEDEQAAASPAPNLEQSLQQLEQLVQRMEAGEQSLDAALGDFETGIKLVRGCRDSLDQAEQRVQILLGDGISSFDGDDSELQQNA